MFRTMTVTSLLLIMLLSIAGCQQAPSPAEAPAPAATAQPEIPPPAESETTPDEDPTIQEVTFTAFEYYFEGPETIPAGWTRIFLDNQGEFSHDLFLAKLDADKTIDDVIADFQTGSEGTPDWAKMHGGLVVEPGEVHSYIVNLTPGNYVYISIGEDENGIPDAAQGMLAALTVTDAPEAAEPDRLEPDLTVELQDFAFVMSGAVEAGDQLIEVRNIGEESHHLIVFQLNEGATFEEFQHFFGSEEPPQGPPPANFHGFLGEHGPGLAAYYDMNFAPGTYVFICFLPSTAHEGAPHFALGMMQEVTVD